MTKTNMQEKERLEKELIAIEKGNNMLKLIELQY